VRGGRYFEKKSPLVRYQGRTLVRDQSRTYQKRTFANVKRVETVEAKKDFCLHKSEEISLVG
jgi:hypothetical protein